MFGLNNAQLIGRLGADVTINHLTNGGRVANMSIATDEGYINRDTGERVDQTTLSFIGTASVSRRDCQACGFMTFATPGRRSRP